MTVVPWQYQVGCNGLLCLLCISSMQQICISSVHDVNMKYRYLTACYAMLTWCIDCVCFIHYQYPDKGIFVLLLRLTIAINVCIGSWASYNFVVKSVDAIYHSRIPSAINSPTWFHQIWYFIVIINIIALIITNSLALVLKNGILFTFYDLILSLVMMIGCIVTFIAICNVHYQLRTVLNSSKQNMKMLEKKNGIDIDELNNRISIEQESKRKYKILRGNKRKLDILLLAAGLFCVAITYSFVTRIIKLNWNDLYQSMYISPYPTLSLYIGHYVIDTMITFVLILWIYKSSKCCTEIARDSMVAITCCNCLEHQNAMVLDENDLIYRKTVNDLNRPFVIKSKYENTDITKMSNANNDESNFINST